MGLHASYYPIPSETLANIITNVHTDKYWPLVSGFREQSVKDGQEFYIGTTWHVLDFVINPPDAAIPELLYAVRGHEFPAPDGSVSSQPRLASYQDDYWQAFAYVTAEEVEAVAQHLSLIDESEFDARFHPEKMKDVYRAPVDGGLDKTEYFEFFEGLRNFYTKVAATKMAVLIDIG